MNWRVEMATKPFTSMSAFAKGYAVYMYGARDGYPDIPETYEPTTQERDEYLRGQALAVQHAQDSEE